MATMGSGMWKGANDTSTEVCQSCLETVLIDLSTKVSFTFGRMERVWQMCPKCSAALRRMVLGYMGEAKPEDGPEEIPNGLGKVLKIEPDARCRCQEERGVEDSINTFLVTPKGVDVAGSIPGGGT